MASVAKCSQQLQENILSEVSAIVPYHIIAPGRPFHPLERLRDDIIDVVGGVGILVDWAGRAVIRVDNPCAIEIDQATGYLAKGDTHPLARILTNADPLVKWNVSRSRVLDPIVKPHRIGP